jgi:NitT/TauT family transport system permease protein/sulfonate transport system permease protein
MIDNVRNSKQNRISAAVISIFVFLIIWQLSTMFTSLGILMPSPLVSLAAFFRSFVEPIGPYPMYLHIYWSLMRVLPFYIIGSVCGIVLGITMGWYKPAAAIFRPIYEVFRPIPPIAWIPIAIVWFGIGEGSKWFLIFLASFMNVTMNSYAGAKSVDPVLVGCSKMLGASNRKIFTSVVLPSSVPYIFAGLQVGLSSSWATVVAAEMIRSSEGVGWIIITSQETNNSVNTLVGVIAIGIVGFVLAIIMRGVEAKLCVWTKREN